MTAGLRVDASGKGLLTADDREGIPAMLIGLHRGAAPGFSPLALAGRGALDLPCVLLELKDDQREWERVLNDSSRQALHRFCSLVLVRKLRLATWADALTAFQESLASAAAHLDALIKLERL